MDSSHGQTWVKINQNICEQHAKEILEVKTCTPLSFSVTQRHQTNWPAVTRVLYQLWWGFCTSCDEGFVPAVMRVLYQLWRGFCTSCDEGSVPAVMRVLSTWFGNQRGGFSYERKVNQNNLPTSENQFPPPPPPPSWIHFLDPTQKQVELYNLELRTISNSNHFPWDILFQSLTIG